MIILDEEEGHVKQDRYYAGPTLRYPEKALGRSDSPLPDYETSEARHKLTFEPLEPLEPFARRPKKLDARLLRAIFYALIIYVLLTAIIGLPIIILKKRQKPHTLPVDPSWNDDNPDLGTSFSISNSDSWLLGLSANCTQTAIQENKDKRAYLTRTVHSFSLSGSFFIQSNITGNFVDQGALDGSLTVAANPDKTATKVSYIVEVAASSYKLLQDTRICFSDTGSYKGMIMHLSGQDVAPADLLSISINVLLPSKPKSTQIPNFVVYLPWFVQQYGNLTDYAIVRFVAEGTGRSINCADIGAAQLSVKNSFAPISGSFRATDSLMLDNIKGSVCGNITLTHDPSQKTATYMSLDTGDGNIDARVTLIHPRVTPASLISHAFSADVKTFNAPLKINFDYSSSTPPIPLQVNVQNNIANTTVMLDGKYEGSFNLQTKLDEAIVQEHHNDSPSTDPLGESRPRTIIYDQRSSSQISGWVGWGRRPSPYEATGQGQVRITSSLGPVVLLVGAPT